jgi:deoxyribodipyrimidine photo-lyase
MPPTLLLFQNDLRLHDNPALQEAIAQGNPVIPIYIRQANHPWPIIGAAQVWLKASLKSLQQDLQKRGSDLLLYEGDPAQVFKTLCKETGSRLVCLTTPYEPSGREMLDTLQQKLPDCEFRTIHGGLLVEPEALHNQSGKPYQVFTPFWRRCMEHAHQWGEPLPTPKRIPAPEDWPDALTIDDLKLTNGMDWETTVSAHWKVGEAHALNQMERFIEKKAARYAEDRDLLWPEDTTSRLSAHLRFGEISPRQIYQALEEAPKLNGDPFLRQLGWREFSYYMLHHFPNTPDQPLKPAFKQFPWQDNDTLFTAWKTGNTGYPIVDAGMRQLWQTGFLPNRVRMLVGSFLVKDLLIPWESGAQWFWETLVDADLANNTMGWQWIAGCGADASPFFRIFNPVTQAEKFDPNGQYVRRWVPELAGLPNNCIQQPWRADKSALRAAKVTLGENYPEPIVSHEVARTKALAAYESLKPSK